MDIKEYCLENEYISFKFLNYGASITSLYFKKYQLETVLRYDDINNYKNNPICLGSSIVGPYAGRIENAKYVINNNEYVLDKNFKSHSIHGGKSNLQNQYYDVVVKDSSATLSLQFNTLNITMTFTLESDKLIQEITTTSTKEIVFNPTNHTYFTLGNTNCLDYVLDLNSDYMYYLNEDSIPKQKVLIDESDFNIVNGKASLSCINSKQYSITKNIDHPFHLKDGHIKLTNLENKLTLNIETNNPFAVIYTSNYLGDCTSKINGSTPYDYMGIAIETQNIPNGVNMLNEDSSILLPSKKHFYKNVYYINPL